MAANVMCGSQSKGARSSLHGENSFLERKASYECLSRSQMISLTALCSEHFRVYIQYSSHYIVILFAFTIHTLFFLSLDYAGHSCPLDRNNPLFHLICIDVTFRQFPIDSRLLPKSY